MTFHQSKALWVWLIVTIALVRAQHALQIQYPPPPPNPQISDLYPQQYVKFTWTSTWPNTSLYIFQGPNSLGNTAYNKLEGSQTSRQQRLFSILTVSLQTELGLESANTPGQPTDSQSTWTATIPSGCISTTPAISPFGNCVSNSTRFYINDQKTTAPSRLDEASDWALGYLLS